MRVPPQSRPMSGFSLACFRAGSTRPVDEIFKKTIIIQNLSAENYYARSSPLTFKAEVPLDPYIGVVGRE